MAEATLTKVKIRPLGDRLLVVPTESKETKRGGIIIPDMAKEKPEQGKVVAVGEGKFENGKRVPMGVKVGDRVVFSRYGYGAGFLKIDKICLFASIKIGYFF